MIYLQLCALLVLPWSFSAETNNETFQAFVDMVVSNLTACDNYKLPVNNENLCSVRSSKGEEFRDFGSFDFIIVGAGSAGTLLANRLTEIKEWKVLLLEAGGKENDFSDIPGMALPLYLTDMNWGYLSTPQERACKAMKESKCVCPRGKVVGGSSTINAKMYSRGNKDDFDAWEKLGNPGWSYQDVLPYFKKTENCHIYNPDPPYRGSGGLLDVNYTAPTVFTSIFLKGKEELGYQLNDYNGKQQIGVSQVQFTIKGNKIASGGRAFIDPFMNRKNLNVTINAFVTRLIIDKEKKRVLGVEFVQDGRKYAAKAKKEVILSAGAINTPQILMISGIGPQEALSKIGVETLVDLPVGLNMEDHAAFTGLNFRTNHTLFNDSIEVLLERYLNDQRPLTAAFNADCVSFINVNDRKSSVPNIEQVLMVPPFENSQAIKVLNLKDVKPLSNPYTDMHVWLILLHPKSKGSVTLKSKDPLDFPNVDYNYYAEEEDLRTMHKGVEETLKLLETKAFKSINATYIPVIEICTEHKEGSHEFWHCMIEHLTSTMYHPVGTTRMGNSSKDAVVTPKLTVYGVERLRVVDAGVIPRIVSANTNAAVYMIAEKAADEIKGLYHRSIATGKQL
ncbi:glucose dehydrogenase [FAD, quinone]-like [Anoplophora glabripennis]|uniref:glucose dehydrogenase [FAD, quinone]-like n=1 Tax=Anoplophora glabripennis TaxID=217634 RepID=UPI0008742166|nr:glucose dehydrogenase [FAD, quinone]-like [Anoplophora glabripennis]